MYKEYKETIDIPINGFQLSAKEGTSVYFSFYFFFVTLEDKQETDSNSKERRICILLYHKM